MLGIAGVGQHVAAFLDQHEIAALAQLDLLDQIGQLIERYVQTKHTDNLALSVGDGMAAIDQDHIVLRPVIDAALHDLSRLRHCLLVPGAHPRVVIAHPRVFRPARVGAIGVPKGEVGCRWMGFGEVVEQFE